MEFNEDFDLSTLEKMTKEYNTSIGNKNFVVVKIENLNYDYHSDLEEVLSCLHLIKKRIKPKYINKLETIEKKLFSIFEANSLNKSRVNRKIQTRHCLIKILVLLLNLEQYAFVSNDIYVNYKVLHECIENYVELFFM